MATSKIQQNIIGGLEPVELFSGTATINTGSNSLSEDVRNFTYIIIECKTNTEVQYNVVPYTALSSSNMINSSMVAHNSNGVQTSIGYWSRCNITFASDFLSFSVGETSNSENYVLKPTHIWGVLRRTN